jgi:hypothetical protein
MKRSTGIRLVMTSSALFLVTSLPTFAKNVATFDFPFAGALAGTEVTPGTYQVSWESRSTVATLTIRKGKKVVATTDGKWVERDVTYDKNAVVYDTAGSGLRRIIELRFAHRHQALVVEESDSKPTAQSALPCAVTTAGGALDIMGRSRQCLEFPGSSGMVGASAEVTSGVSLASIAKRTFPAESPLK